MARWPCGSYVNLVWGLEVGRLPLIIQMAQNVIIRVLPGGAPLLQRGGDRIFQALLWYL